ncbi:PhnD/SsuA/transferrin family substrate-binding protein [Phytopseudomonas dryadis]|uniref:Nitrate ABC transporter substrate-binding protein n=1 Tax=Phytopseudomonas dryadis TaxID=2487520 RepID=A0A4V2KCF7_9GAMM|nr:PhnD/SsuA/transferrin family substrate-binding protein [Pseudomonas dryadis]TBU93997.1 nitrate ABC transporter substrate-binding protein [Pseudomonas dryadis]
MSGFRILVHALLAILAGVASGLVMAAEAPKAVRIAVVAYNSAGKTVFNGPAYVIERDQWLQRELAKQGIELQWVPAATASVGTFVNEEFANQRIDFAFYGDLPSTILNASGVATRLIAAGGSGNNVYLVVPSDSSATAIEDLKGKRIALHRGRPWELPAARLLQSRGLDFSDFRLFNLNPQAGGAALSAGRVDGFFTLSDAYLLEDKQVGKIIWSTKQAPQDWKMRAELFGAAAFVERYPEITQLVVNAYLKAAYWASREANRDEYLQHLAQSGQPESVLRRESDGEPWTAQFSPLIDASVRQHYRDVVAYSLQAKLIRSGFDVDRLIDERFVDQGVRELGLQDEWQAVDAPAKP